MRFFGEGVIMKKKLYYIICLCGLISIMLCAVFPMSPNDCGTQIGYLDGETDDRVCEYKEYPWNVEKEDLIPMVMVNDVFYLAAGHEKEVG